MLVMLRNRLAVFLAAICITLNCYAAELKVFQVPGDTVVKIQINLKVNHQIIRHFGASDAWACQFVGNWPDAKKNAIADLLFSRDTLPEGNLKGIGLSLWRFNLGAGTTEQGDASGIRDDWRRTETFRNKDGSYNWAKQGGQLWFMKAARERGVREFLIFPNTPPTHLTVNQRGYAPEAKPILKPEHFSDFGNFMADVIEGIHKQTGIMFQYVSPVNEPQWDWDHGGQEGTPFLNDHVASITKSLSKSLLEKKLPTQIAIAEASRIEYVYSGYERPARGENLYTYFDKKSPHYMGNLPNVLPVITGHSYLTTSPFDIAVNKRKELTSRVSTVPGLEYWMTEYCILGDNEGEIKGEGLDLSITAALYMAKVIHNDLVHANASAWHWWLAVSPYDYKDGLVYIDKNKTDGGFRTSKMLWALGNFSAFIRPGAVRIEVAAANENPNLLASSYRNTNGEISTILVNSGETPISVSLTSPGDQFVISKQYETSASRDLQQIPIAKVGGAIIIQPFSVNSIIGNIAER